MLELNRCSVLWINKCRVKCVETLNSSPVIGMYPCSDHRRGCSVCLAQTQLLPTWHHGRSDRKSVPGSRSAFRKEWRSDLSHLVFATRHRLKTRRWRNTMILSGKWWNSNVQIGYWCPPHVHSNIYCGQDTFIYENAFWWTQWGSLAIILNINIIDL